MHEMSIAVNIIDIAGAEAARAEARVVNSVVIDLGELAGVETESLRFCFQTARNGTALENADLQINEIPGRGRCPACETEHAVDFFVALCPDCGAPMEIIAGRELKVRSLNID